MFSRVYSPWHQLQPPLFIQLYSLTECKDSIQAGDFCSNGLQILYKLSSLIFSCIDCFCLDSSLQTGQRKCWAGSCKGNGIGSRFSAEKGDRADGDAAAKWGSALRERSVALSTAAELSTKACRHSKRIQVKFKLDISLNKKAIKWDLKCIVSLVFTN